MDASCPRCDADLDPQGWGAGAVWVCPEHGVVAWYFEDQANVDLTLALLTRM